MTLFDAKEILCEVARDYECMKPWIDDPSHIMHSPDFEMGIIKILANRSRKNLLQSLEGVEERETNKNLKKTKVKSDPCTRKREQIHSSHFHTSHIKSCGACVCLADQESQLSYSFSNYDQDLWFCKQARELDEIDE